MKLYRKMSLSILIPAAMLLASCGDKAAEEDATSEAPHAEAVAEDAADAAMNAGADAAAADAAAVDSAAAATADAKANPDEDDPECAQVCRASQ